MFEQLTIKTAAAKTPSKVATKAPAKKTSAAATAKKGAAKTSEKTVRKAAPAKVPSAIKFAVEDFARPKAGAMLAAHTQAFLDLSGLAIGEAIPRATATRIIGVRAVAYHKDNGNFEVTDKGLTLTDKGVEFFISRQADAELYAAYVEFFKTGKQNPAINVKTAGSIVAI